MTPEAVLVGDVGGTKVRFALAVRRAGTFRVERFEVFPGDDFPDFGAVLSEYLTSSGVRCDVACMAMAGPVQENAGELTNRGWTLSGPALAREFGFRHVRIINDFTAMARSVPELDADTFETILEGTPIAGRPVLVAGPGTGFGVATLIRGADGSWSVLSGEGGHSAFAPRNDLEHDLVRILRRDHGYVSSELVASGSGLPHVHAAFCEIYGVACMPVSPAQMRARADSGEEMYRRLIEVRALAVMGAVGDFALINGTLGGVVLAGGVSERIADFLKTPQAAERFCVRGPMSHYLAHCPVRLMHDPVAPLIGAAAFFSDRR